MDHHINHLSLIAADPVAQQSAPTNFPRSAYCHLVPTCSSRLRSACRGRAICPQIRCGVRPGRSRRAPQILQFRNADRRATDEVHTGLRATALDWRDIHEVWPVADSLLLRSREMMRNSGLRRQLIRFSNERVATSVWRATHVTLLSFRHRDAGSHDSAAASARRRSLMAPPGLPHHLFIDG